VWAADNLSSATASATASNADDPLNMDISTTRPSYNPDLESISGPTLVIEPTRVVRVWTITPKPRDEQVAAVKAEAQRRIYARYPEWKQDNMAARDNELIRIQMGLMIDGACRRPGADTERGAPLIELRRRDARPHLGDRLIASAQGKLHLRSNGGVNDDRTVRKVARKGEGDALPASRPLDIGRYALAEPYER
jgi:hypothetical protein